MTLEQAIRTARWLLPLAIWAVVAAAVPAQDRELKAPGLRVIHEEGLAGGARRLVREFPRLLRDAEKKLGFAYPRELTVRLVRDHRSFNEIIRRRGGRERPEHVAAVAFGLADLVVLKSNAWVRSPGNEAETIFQHEIVHCMLGHLVREHPRCRLPLWFEEGLAQWVSERLYRGDSGILDGALRADKLIPFDALLRDFPDHEHASALAYAQSLSLVRFISGHGARDEKARGNLRAMLVILCRGTRFEDALRIATGLDFASLERAWISEMRRRVPLSVQQLPSFLFGGTILILSLLLWATLRVRRERRFAEFDASDDDE